MWSVEVRFRKSRDTDQRGYISIYLYRSTEDIEEESEFSNLIYVQAGNNEIFSQTIFESSTTCFQTGLPLGYNDLATLSTLEGKAQLTLGLLFTSKRNDADGNAI